MKPIKCINCSLNKNNPNTASKVLRYGSYHRRSDRKKVQRFYCRSCCLHFSIGTTSKNYKQKKRQINHKVARLLVAGVSQRECSRVLKINVKTVVRKFLIMGLRAKDKLEKLNKNRSRVINMQFDDLETFEHTKCKPVSVTLAVEEKTRWIIGYEVSQMPAKGLLVKTAIKKYGYREDQRSIGRANLFERIRPYIANGCLIKSDQNPHYIEDVKRYFPESYHERYKGRKSAVTAQGELKKQQFDPIFSLNHTCAVARYRLSRLIRKTWNTTKLKERLDLHFALLSVYHNLSLKLTNLSTA